tara:strand:- start:251 stop:400 length:150 start_codon:yes stop_codon:yes gene_type:complete
MPYHTHTDKQFIDPKKRVIADAIKQTYKLELQILTARLDLSKKLWNDVN